MGRKVGQTHSQCLWLLNEIKGAKNECKHEGERENVWNFGSFVGHVNIYIINSHYLSAKKGESKGWR